MQLKHSEFGIPENAPYQNDLFNRSEFGESLTKIVSNISGALTISINGPWGTGKTIFLKMWNQHLKDNGFSTIYFSAWEDDHCDNALIALLGQIWANIKSNDWQEMGKTLKETALLLIMNLGGQLVKNFGSQILTKGISLASAGVLELDLEILKSQSEKMLEEYAATISEMNAVKVKLAAASESCRKKRESRWLLSSTNWIVVVHFLLSNCWRESNIHPPGSRAARPPYPAKSSNRNFQQAILVSFVPL